MIAPLLMIMLFGIVDFSWVLGNKVVITNAAREAARLGATGASETAIKQRAVDLSRGLVADLTHVDVEFFDTNGDGRLLPGDAVAVRVRYTYEAITPLGQLVGFDVLDGRVLTSCTDMRLEQVWSGATISAGAGPCE